METQKPYEVKDRRLTPETTGDVVVTDNSPATLMQMALNRGTDLDKLEKMLVLQERWEQNEAKKAYHEAMSQFKTNPPQIEKDRKVGYQPQGKAYVGYSHASLANVTTKINRALSEHGLSAAWKTDQEENNIKVTCTITHKMGHSESTSLTAAPDTSGSKNSIQAIGSTISYLERYTILALTGLATHDMDDDGQGAETEFITEKQRVELEKIIVEKDVDVEKFLKYMGVDDLETIQANLFGKAKTALMKAKGKTNGDS